MQSFHMVSDNHLCRAKVEQDRGKTENHQEQAVKLRYRFDHNELLLLFHQMFQIDRLVDLLLDLHYTAEDLYQVQEYRQEILYNLHSNMLLPQFGTFYMFFLLLSLL
jgi:hypothetical protein